MKLINNDIYLLLIDEEAEIMYNDLCYDIYGSPGYNNIKYVVRCLRSANDSYWNKHTSKIIAYRKLNSEAKELDLLLLPNPFKSNYKHPFYALLSAIDILKSDGFDERCDVLIHLKETKNFIQNVMQFKQFSLEDMKKAIRFAYNAGRRVEMNAVPPDFKFETYREELIQSLSTQQLPKEFKPIMVCGRCLKPDDNDEDCWSAKECSRNTDFPDTFKTIINSKGKQELVGTYKY